MRGYWGLPEETARVLKPGNYPGEVVLHTGDLFLTDDDGYLYFMGRKDDMIKSRGERISPKEIEQCLHEFEGISEAAVIGIPDDILGQAIIAYIRCSTENKVTERSVLRYCQENLEDFMVPREIRFIEEFPKNSNSKIDKRVLADMATEPVKTALTT
jgi:acyl-coenzyme A synthetase/AMP-(fatty) acid ligase